MQKSGCVDANSDAKPESTYLKLSKNYTFPYTKNPDIKGV
jgi:hypothetical protein